MTDMEIEAFLAIVHAGSISRAANELYISQSALSRRVKSLEDELGYQLFVRNKGVRAVELTKSGQAFIEPASKWKTLWGEMMDIGALNNQMVLNLSAVNSILCVMPGYFHHFMVENPDIYLTIRTVPSVDVFRYVENGIMDLALFTDDSYVPNANMRPVYSESLVMISRRDNGYPVEITAEQLDVSKLIYMPWNREFEFWYNRWFPSSKRAKVLINSARVMEDILQMGDYWAIVPASVGCFLMRHPELSTHKIRNGPPDRVVYYLRGPYQKREACRRFMTGFVQYVAAEYEGIVTPLLDFKALEE